MKKDDPYQYLHFIKEFWEAYKILEKHKPLPVNLFFPKAFILGRVVELIFKTQLIIKGYHSNDLKKKQIGSHNLVKLLDLLGFPGKYVMDPTSYDAIAHLNVYYKDKNYEYPQLKDVELKNVKFLERFIELSISKIENNSSTY